MAAADQQFLDALKYLGQQGQAYGIKQQMNDVNDRAQEIQSTMTDEIKKRAALRNLAQSASLSVAGSGGSAQDAAAIQNLIPPIPTTVQSAYLQGAMTGDKQMVSVAKKMQDEDEARAIRAFQRKATFQMQLELQKEKAKPNPEQMAVLKENRKKYDDLLSSRQQAVETLAKLNNVKTLLGKGTLFDTGPIDKFSTTFSPEAQILEQHMNDLSLHNMVNMFNGMSKAVDTEAERKAFESTQLSMGHYASTNMNYAEEQKKAILSTLRKTDKAIYSFKNTRGLSFDAFDEVPTKDAAPGFKPMAPAGSLKAFYKSGK